jgi:hypothetical protein
MDKQNKEIEISEPRMVKSHDVKLDAEYAECNHGDRYMIHQHKILISQIIDYFCKRKRY